MDYPNLGIHTYSLNPVKLGIKNLVLGCIEKASPFRPPRFPLAMPSKIPSLLIGALLSIGATLHAETRTFTSPDGRTMQAEVTAATPDKVSLKLANGQIIVTEVSRFSEADQVFIAEWRKLNPETIKYDFTANYTKEKGSSEKSRRGNVQLVTENWMCNLELTNKSGQTLEGLKVDYEIYYTLTYGPKPQPRKTTGTLQVPSIKSLEKVTLKTNAVSLESRKLDGGFYYGDGTRSRTKDEIDGVYIKVSHNGKMVYDWTSQGLPADRGGIASDEKARR